MTKDNGIVEKRQIAVNADNDKVNQDNGMPVKQIRIIDSNNNETVLTGDRMNLGGELTGLIYSYGYQDGTKIKGSYPEMIEKLNNMAKAFADEFNRIHTGGYTLNSISNQPDGGEFFDMDDNNPAQTIKVDSDIISDPSKIAAGKGNGHAANNENIMLLTALKTKAFTQYGANGATSPEGVTGNLDSFYAGIIGSLGVESQSAIKNLGNATTIAASIEERRQSISSVSLDEEMVNMISFQHAYNASSRMITVVDEMLDKIINGMGVVGR